MALIDNKINAYANPVSSLPDKPSQAGMSAAALKAAFDANATGEIKTAINGIIDCLLAITDGASGADNIGATAIVGVDGTTVQAQLESIKSQLNDVALGLIPDNSLTNDKLVSDIKIGSLANLNTTDKSSVVNAINEHETVINALPLVINDLTTGGTTNSLSAEQGKLLGSKVLSQPLNYSGTIAAGSAYVDLVNFDLAIYRNFVFQGGSITIDVVFDDTNDLLVGTQCGISGGSNMLGYTSPTILNTNVKLFDLGGATTYAKLYARIENNNLYFVALQSTNTSVWKAIAW